MPILQIQHKTRDFDSWKKSFDGDPVGREQGGVRNYRILRGTDDPNYVVIELGFDSTDEAEKFSAALRELWDRVGNDLGLEGPQARILDTAETGEY
jgi:hypothetical protein